MTTYYLLHTPFAGGVAPKKFDELRIKFGFTDIGQVRHQWVSDTDVVQTILDIQGTLFNSADYLLVVDMPGKPILVRSNVEPSLGVQEINGNLDRGGLLIVLSREEEWFSNRSRP